MSSSTTTDEPSTTASAIDFILSADLMTQGALATRRERLRVFNQLYECQWTCQTMFQRGLSPLAQNYAARLICVSPSAPVSAELVNKWVMPGADSEDRHDEALWQLQRLCILLPTEILDADHYADTLAVVHNDGILHDDVVVDDDGIRSIPLQLTGSEAGIVMNHVF